MDAGDDRIRAFQEELIHSAQARREEVGDEMRAIESRVRALQEEQLESAEARRAEIRREMDAGDDRIRAFQEELIASAQARRDEVGAGIETAQGEIQVVEEELDCMDERSRRRRLCFVVGKCVCLGERRLRPHKGSGWQGRGDRRYNHQADDFRHRKEHPAPYRFPDDCRQVRSANCQIWGTDDFRFQTRREGACGHGLAEPGRFPVA